jgi:transcription antitermination factor NusG
MQGATYQIGQHVGFVDLIDRSEEDRFPNSKTARWYCAVTKSNCQARASLGLYELGYRSFYPKVLRWVSHARTKVAKEKPLLGRYLFVEVDPQNEQQSFYDVRQVKGVESVLSSWQETSAGVGIAPTPFPSRYVEDLRIRQMSGEWDEIAKGPLPVGARIRVVEGEFADMLATVTSRKGRRIDFKLFGENRYGRLNDCSVRAA